MVWGRQQEDDSVFADDRLREIVAKYDTGALRPLVGATFPMAEAGKAMQALLSRRIPGKIVLVP